MKKFLLFLCTSFAITSYNTANAQWVQANTGLTINEVNSFATIGTTIFAATGNISGNGKGVFKSTDNGANWTAVNTGLISLDIRKIIAVGSTLYVAVAATNLTDGGVYKSTDNGANWVSASNGLARLIAYSIVYSGTTLYTSISAPASARDVYTSTDGGANWTKTTSTVLNNNTIKSMVTSGGNLIAASDGGSAGVYLSTDNGSTWAATSITGECDAVAVIGSTVFAATGTGVYKSTDNGATWNITTKVSGVIDNATAFAVTGTTLVVGAPSGVYSSTDNGTVWNNKSDGAGGSNLPVEAFGMDATYIYAGICFKSVGIWRRPLSDFATVPTVTTTPTPTTTTTSTTTPNAPSNLTLTLQKASITGQITLTWTDNSTNETGFKIEKSLDGTAWTNVATVTAATYDDTALVDGTLYYYRVAAYNGNGTSGYSNVASATTTINTGVEDLDKNNLFSIFPNPASTSLTVICPMNNQQTTITIDNNMGQMVFSKQVSTGQETIDISQLPKGFYIVKIDHGTIKYSEKIVVQ